MGFVYPAYEISYNTATYELGLSYNWIYYGLGTMINAINNNGYGGYTVETVGGMTGQYILNTQCQAAITFALIAFPASIEALTTVGLTWATAAGLGASAGSLAFGCT